MSVTERSSVSLGRSLACATLMLAMAGVAGASDGLIELDQTCAVSTGCMPGDTPGFPITITGDGGRSFVLVSDLIVPGTDTDGIQILVSDVSIDLNDHTILRPECAAGPSDCVSSGVDAIGVLDLSAASTVGGVVVRDGTIAGFVFGLYLGRGAEARNVSARWNVFGITALGHGSLLLENLTESNAFIGLSANFGFEAGTVLIGNRASENAVLLAGGGTGTAVGGGAEALGPGVVVTDNVAFGNGRSGFRFEETSVVVDNATYGNLQPGLTVLDGSVVHRNTAYENGVSNLEIGGGTLVRGNVVRGGSGEGITADLPAGQGHLENVVSDNAGGDVVGTRLDLGANACGGTPGCP